MVNSSSTLSPKQSVLTVNDVAEILKVCPRTVLNMAKKGDIPASRIGHLWRFEENEIHLWIKQKSETTNNHKDSAPPSSFPDSLMEFLKPSQIRFEKSVERPAVLEDLASLVIRSGKYNDYAQLLASLEEREAMFSTALDDGVAFPHPRRPLPQLTEPILSVLVVESGVEFGAPGGGKTHIFVLFCAPNDSLHVRILARLAHVFHNQRRLINKIKHLSQPEKILEELIRAENENRNGFLKKELTNVCQKPGVGARSLESWSCS
ncbi:PTS sugar transporter subunit IIA [Candidatus Sumerlaeota bacterium]|nr:PTS sugar transporter subunit IIA [Candidatus Sumerlaeota bacterium]